MAKTPRTIAKEAGKSPRKRYPLPRRFNAALSEQAYANLRGLNAAYGLGNNYLLSVLLENLYEITDPSRIKHAFDLFIAEYGAPTPGVGMKKE